MIADLDTLLIALHVEKTDRIILSLGNGGRGVGRPPVVTDAELAALAIIVAGGDLAAAVPVAPQTLDAVTNPGARQPGRMEFAGGWQEVATLTLALQPPDRARLGDAMAAVITDGDEAAWNRQEALAALANVGRHLADDDRDRLFPIALQAARGDLDRNPDDDTLPSGPLDRIRHITGDPTLRYAGLLAAAALASAPERYEVMIDLA